MKEKIEALSFKNYQLGFMVKMLNVPLHSAKARARNRFYKIIESKLERLEKSRIDMLEKYGKKNEETNTYDLKNPEKFQAEFKKMQEEVCIIDLLPSTKADLLIVKDIFKTTKVEMDVTTTEIYEEIMTEIEKI